ncbi:MAG: LiaF transmembrane domain-containing protein [Chloroflexota bacterium]
MQTTQDERRTHQRHHPSAWGSGVVLIGVGLVFLLVNAGLLPTIGNWWALFLLIPALVLLVNAWARYRAEGAFTRSAAAMLTGALFPLIVATIFLFNLDWGKMWPAFIIVAGLSTLLSSRARS